MKVYLDDVRPTPAGFDVRVYTAQGAIDVLSSGRVTMISLDNDLGEGDVGEGRDVAKWLEIAAFHNDIPRCEIRIHSANPVARKYMEQAIAQADKFWKHYEGYV